jgi:CRISPR/Cas system-associated exonuclease Cas4 (RecB family)
MPVKKLKVLTAWSFSRWDKHAQCPLKARLSFIDKLKEPSSPQMERGAKIGEAAEQYVKGLIPASPLPPELERFAEEFKMLRKRYAKKNHDGVVVEETWTFKSPAQGWAETTWDDWNNAWLRVKTDVAFTEGKDTLVIWDWKTGKYREDSENVEKYMFQLELYALAALLKFPKVKKVKVRLAFLDAGVFHPPDGQEPEYTPADVPRLKALWVKRTNAMLVDTIFPARPNQYCKWCWFRKANAANGGGQCAY